MIQKINIAKILKDCPKGTKLYSPIFGEGKLTKITDRIHVHFPKEHNHKLFNIFGKFSADGECLLFPSKENRDWSTFQRPFVDGDIVITTLGSLAILKDYHLGDSYQTYCFLVGDILDITQGFIKPKSIATEEEKVKLFDAIKENGYKWNPDTKTLEKLIKPKFKAGDKIVKKNGISVPVEITSVVDEFYYSNTHISVGILPIKDQDDWELVVDKFDISTLKPFDKVLVRSDNSDIWECDFFSSYNSECSNRFHCIGAWYNICIPYIGNEHLRGTTNDCDEFYKNW